MTHLKKIERFLLLKVAADLGRRSLDPDEDLLDQNIIDSLGLLKLVTFLEHSLGIQVHDEDIVPDNFQTLSAIARLVEQKIGVQSPQIRPKPCSPMDMQSKPLIIDQSAQQMMSFAQ